MGHVVQGTTETESHTLQDYWNFAARKEISHQIEKFPFELNFFLNIFSKHKVSMHVS